MPMTKQRTVTLLCSGFGLGLYVPGLLIAKRLRRLGVQADVCVFENVILPNKLDQVLRSKQACHRSFPFAQFSAKMPMDMTSTVDDEAIDALLDQWAAEGRREFLVFSGHWLHVVNRYRDKVHPETVNAEIVYVDCGLPPSWTSLKHFEPNYAAGYRETWIYDTEKMALALPIAVNDAPPLPYREREPRFVIHGGGWGMGTYQNKIPEWRARGIPLDIVVYETEEAAGGAAADRFFMMDPSWS
ncbi:MAG: UDP-glucuronosyltransferase, partial [Cohnella sp.]|nr:UDP-glucuronosyltransferase [Cohnella sp.]